MRYLLDSNFCIALINGTASPQSKARMISGQRSGDTFLVSTIVVHELWYGVAKSEQVAANTRSLGRFLSWPLEVLDFNANDARVAGEIRALLARRGTPIGPYDTLIAGQALARGLTLVTANTREFARVDGLSLVNWAE
jgi:tRNA(fMet)-specific endonuclease VapC